jgi:hypothetical protein
VSVGAGVWLEWVQFLPHTREAPGSVPQHNNNDNNNNADDDGDEVSVV